MSQPAEALQRIYHALLPEKRRLAIYKQAPRLLKRLIDRLGRVALPQSPESLRESRFLSPTREDIYYIHRLLLKRKPEPEEIDLWLDHVHRYNYDLHRLVHDFLFGDEYVKKQAERNQPKLVETDSFDIYVRLNDYSTGWVIANHHAYEPEVMAQIRHRVKPGDTFIDIGANIGFHALLAAALTGAEGRVIAFEPHPANCDLLAMSIRENGFDHVELHPLAVGDQLGKLELLITGTYSNARLQTTAGSGNLGDRLEIVDVVKLDDFLAGIDRIDVIKMDIEGAEALAWRGMEGLLSKHRPVVLTEFFPDFIRLTSGVDPREYLQRMIDTGYDLHRIDQGIISSRPPLSIDDIVHAHQVSGGTHIDLVALPRR